jgi:hypothetical protein
LQPRILGKLAVNLVAVSLVPGTLSLLAASFLKRRGMAAGAVGILTLALYLLNFLAELLPRLRPSAPLSPFHYYQPIGIVSGFGTRWAGDVLLLVGTAAVLSALAFVVFSRRDL